MIMGVPSELRPDMSVTDLAFTILKNYGKPMHFKQLISEVMRVKAINQENPGRLIAQMHTEINLDSRFIHHGNGEWGLREWQPKSSKVVKIRPEGSTPAGSRSRAGVADAEEDDFGFDAEEEEDLVDEVDDEFGLDEDEYEDEEPMDEEEEDEDER
ncbi:MAG: DNA-directed RNA polymerase subunit delta [Bacillota bacterium]